jgi:phosphatidate cytidylyltransferase
LYILIGFNAIILVHDWVNSGEFLYLIPFLGAWITDIFAYFCGMLFGRGGKHPLIPEVSPKKTVEGSIGGTVFGSASYLLFGLAISLITAANSDIVGVVLTPNYVALAIYGLIISVVSQIGDLAMSWIKREHGVKDYGKIFPGHGGVLDRFDSVLITAPLLLLFSTLEGPLAMFF